MAGDVAEFEKIMPTGGHNAHAHFFSRQLRGECSYLVARWNGSPAGSAVVSWTGCRDDEIRSALPATPEIGNLSVRPDLRGSGIGSSIIAAAEVRAEARGIRQIALAVGVDNAAAARLYQRLGYRDSGLRSTSRYMYPDNAGLLREVVEHDMEFVKALVPT